MNLLWHDDEVIEFLKVFPKESLELIVRNVKIRELLVRIWNSYVSGRLEYDEDFEEIFNQIFRMFFRPLEFALNMAKLVKLVFPDVETLRTVEVQRDVVEAYDEFLKSLFDYVRNLGVVPAQSDEMREIIREVREYYDVMVEFPLAISRETARYLFECMDYWEGFRESYYKLKALVRGCYRKAVENFVRYARENEIREFNAFTKDFQDFAAKEFDELLKSGEYLEAQKTMIDNLMDHFYCLRRFYESMLEQNPSTPFATVAQIDEAYRRITDLRRDVIEIKKRLNLD